MRIFIKHILPALIILITVKTIDAQCLIGENEIRVKFLKEKVDVEPGKTFFDVLIIENISSREISLTTNINVPKNWTIIGQSSEKYIIEANSKLSLPVRVIVSTNATGGVGYVVAATILDEKGSLFKTEYSYLAIPIKTGLIINAGNRASYFDNTSLTGQFRIDIKNEGNISEIIRIKASPDKSLVIPESENNLHIEDITLHPNKDTTIFVPVKLINIDEYKKYMLHKVSLTVTGKDTLVNKTIWFRYLGWEYEKVIHENNLPLVVELSAHNIFNPAPATYRGRIFGKTLLKNKKSIFYFLESWNLGQLGYEPYTNTKMYVGYSSPKLFINLGDYQGGMIDQNLLGRGLHARYQISDNHTVMMAISRRILQPVNNFGAAYRVRIKRIVNIEMGGSYSVHEINRSVTNKVYQKTSFNIKRKNNISLLTGVGEKDYFINGTNQTYRGFGYNLDYAGSLKTIKINIKSYFGTPDYSDYSAGRFYIAANANQRLKNNSWLNYSATSQKYQPAYFVDNIRYADRYTISDQYKILMTVALENNIYVFGGPIVEHNSTNNYAIIDPAEAFKTLTYKAEAGFNVREQYSSNSLTFRARYGYVDIYQFSDIISGVYHPEITDIKPIQIAELSLNVKRQFFGVHLMYFYGPVNISQQFSYFYNNYFARSINIMPYYEKFIYKENLKLTVRGSYVNNLSSYNSRLNLNAKIDLFANRGLSMYFLTAINMQTRKSFGFSGNSFYSSTYFEFGLRKVFQWNQPRTRYYDLDAIFYKDLNGNRVHDQNEPGVRNVLVNIQRKDPMADAQDPNYGGEFANMELLSNAEGRIRYKNIVEGDYLIKYNPITGITDNFSAEESKKEYTSEKDTVMYIPFTEKNKVFGKVVVHRAPLSALENVPLDNIKITVEGSGKIYEALTDHDGYFELYLPVSDYYRVSINNIYHENFDVRREYYIVKFNGYKQFELTFDFDERKREIKFEESDFIVQEGEDFNLEDIRVIRQTNLKGVVRDANSLNPLHANIQVRNSRNNDLVAEAASSLRTGEYYTTFFAGESYELIAESKNYWNYKEKLEIDQITAFDNITRDILLNKIYEGEVLRVDNLTFSYGRFDLSQIAKVQLDVVIKRLTDNPSVHVQIVGYTDNIEAINLNAKSVSEQRANSVADYLKSKGLQPNRISIKGEGDKNPAHDNDTENGRAMNRRVEIIVLKY